MEIQLAENLKIETEVPLLRVETFFMSWSPNTHACLQVTGLLNRSMPCRWERLYESKIKLWKEDDAGMQILFHGYLKTVEKNMMAATEGICLRAESGSCKLDIREQSRSFQNTKMSYWESAKQVIEENGGQAICIERSNVQIGRPIICYQETPWNFSKRMAGRANTCIVADIESGKAALWFGLPKGRTIPLFSEEEYSVKLENTGQKTSISYVVQSREFYKIGDRTVFCGHDVMILGVVVSYERGQLTFTYLLRTQITDIPSPYQEQFTGAGLCGHVLDVKGESVKVALDIDGGQASGEYYYDWYSETGNALYAMPEKGAQIVLYFGSSDEQEGYVIHCLPNTQEDRGYKERCLELENGGTINLTEGSLAFVREDGQQLSLTDSTVSLGTPREMRISAEGKIKLKARQIILAADDEVKMCQG